MTDEVKAETQEVQPAVEPQSTEQTVQGEESQEEHNTGTDQDVQVKAEEAPTEQEKPKRSEKRIKDLARKLADARKPAEQQYGYEWPNPQLTPSEDGTLSPEQLDQYVSAKANQIVEMRLAMDGEQRAYQQQVETYLSDMETTAALIENDFKDSPEVADKVNELLTEINKRTNLDESGKLTPRIKTSELYQQLKDTLNLSRQSGQQHTSVKLAEQIAEGAITPSSKQPETSNYSEMSTDDIWKNPGAVRASMRAKLPIAQD